MKANRKNVVIEVISALFIILFVYAALSKVQDFEKFGVELSKSPILNVFAGQIAIVVPVLELILSILLAVKRIQFYALYIAFTLMVVFSTYIVVILKFSAYIPCSCGGILQNMTWNQHFVFNILFVLMAMVAILIYPKNTEDLIRGKKGRLHP